MSITDLLWYAGVFPNVPDYNIPINKLKINESTLGTSIIFISQ